MSPNESASGFKTKALSVVLGVAGVAAFSFTLPATKLAVPAFGTLTVGIGRAVPAALLAMVFLAVRRERLLPPRGILRPLLMTVAGVVIGFPLFATLAMNYVDSSYGAVVVGLIPVATAGMAVLRAGERPARGYWVALGLGVVAVLSFAVVQGAGLPRLGDLLLVASVVMAGVGYAYGGVLARRFGGWRVICWALVVALPVSVPIAIAGLLVHPPTELTLAAVSGMSYVAVVSMLLGFFVWYQALAMGGVAKVGQLQLAQPVLTIGWSVLLLRETIDLATVIAAAGVLLTVLIGARSRVTLVPATEVHAEPFPPAGQPDHRAQAAKSAKV